MTKIFKMCLVGASLAMLLSVTGLYGVSSKKAKSSAGCGGRTPGNGGTQYLYVNNYTKKDVRVMVATHVCNVSVQEVTRTAIADTLNQVLDYKSIPPYDQTYIRGHGKVICTDGLHSPFTLDQPSDNKEFRAGAYTVRPNWYHSQSTWRLEITVADVSAAQAAKEELERKLKGEIEEGSGGIYTPKGAIMIDDVIERK